MYGLVAENSRNHSRDFPLTSTSTELQQDAVDHGGRVQDDMTSDRKHFFQVSSFIAPRVRQFRCRHMYSMYVPDQTHDQRTNSRHLPSRLYAFYATEALGL